MTAKKWTRYLVLILVVSGVASWGATAVFSQSARCGLTQSGPQGPEIGQSAPACGGYGDGPNGMYIDGVCYEGLPVDCTV